MGMADSEVLQLEEVLLSQLVHRPGVRGHN